MNRKPSLIRVVGLIRKQIKQLDINRGYQKVKSRVRITHNRGCKINCVSPKKHLKYYYLMAKVIHKKGSEELAKLFLETYDPQSSDDVQNSFKDMIGTVFEALLQGELTDHLRFENNDHSAKDTTNRRNGSSKKH